MCTSPLKVLNPTRTFRPNSARAWVSVPCGTCPDCRSNQSKEWFIRCQQHYKDNDGVTVYATFTYAPKNVPRFSDVLDDGSVVSFPVFSHDDVKKFNKDIRHYFEKHGLKECFTSIVCCEYGSFDKEYNQIRKDGTVVHRKTTCAPHYHSLLFFNHAAYMCLCDQGFQVTEWNKKTKSYNKVHRVLRNPEDMKKFIEKFWSKGYVRWSKSKPDGPGIFVDSEFAGEYVTKYVCKDLNFYGHPDVAKYLYDKDGNKIQSHYDKIKNMLPKHWQCQGFGLGLKKLVSEDPVSAFRDGIVLDGLKKDIELGKVSRFKVPRYIERKLLYNYNKSDGSYFLNKLGIDVKTTLFNDKVIKLTKRLQDAISEQNRSVHNDDYAKKVFNLDVSIPQYLNSLMLGRTCHDLALFSLVWKGKVCSDLDTLYLLDRLSDVDFCTVSSEKYLDDLYPEQSLIVDDDGYFKTLRKKGILRELILYDACPRFENFNRVLDVINCVQNYKRNNQQLAYLQDREKRKQLKYQLYA